MNRALEQVARLVQAESGILIRENQFGALKGAVARAFGRPDPEELLRSASDAIAGPDTVARLIDEVTVGETFFLRDRRQLETIDWRAAFARADGGQVSVWSAACSTGEEPYSLALLAAEAFRPAPPPVRILATDISRLALAAAQRGRYRPRAVREVDPELSGRYFDEHAGTYLVGEQLRRCVSFARHNLVRDPVPPLGETGFDVIVCRNVLIYFDAETTARVLDRLEQALRPGGTLVLGVADALCRPAAPPARLAAAPAPKARRRPNLILLRAEPAPGPAAVRSVEDLLAAALAAADAGRPVDGLAEAEAAAALDPLNAEAYFVRGLLELDSGRTDAAIASLRRALYVDSSFGLAAFKLARAYEAAGDEAAARRSYEQALRSLDLEDERHETLLRQVDLGDVASACRSRLRVLA